ncbi:MAG TPA: DsbE family thiol:disulfide interchange protein [Geminicoccus sp.]|jgi:cytochrome c biogenesis protein CcmG/thiol:disulfide interchange protein DsbE|uniref:DsbE family thiol:disulfide interchange protein n=1 Tax=Geminicoccus sp. TaxID=2024832 RepID=UPI002E2F1265|nr:DsbE family thiol:disulfide interchange protein [Geminicoccus sp.]HEX2526506.1 DsbE family thiol:disulfide interchange protein [Geminicoccus sp.]
MSAADDVAVSTRDSARRLGVRHLLAVIPLLVFAALGVTFWLNMGRDPGQLPSALIDKPVPSFTLPAMPGRSDSGLSDADLRKGEVVLLNVFASWCVPCRIEHPVLMRLKEEGMPVYGINYKDDPVKGEAFLAQLGDPYQKIGADRNGRVSIDFGVYGVPETFVVDGDGRILFRFPGPLTPEIFQDQVLPVIEKARG